MIIGLLWILYAALLVFFIKRLREEIETKTEMSGGSFFLMLVILVSPMYLLVMGGAAQELIVAWMGIVLGFMFLVVIALVAAFWKRWFEG